MPCMVYACMRLCSIAIWKGKHAGAKSTYHKDEHKDDSKEGTASCTLEEVLPAKLRQILEKFDFAAKLQKACGGAGRHRLQYIPVLSLILWHKSLLVVNDGMKLLQVTGNYYHPGLKGKPNRSQGQSSSRRTS